VARNQAGQVDVFNTRDLDLRTQAQKDAGQHGVLFSTLGASPRSRLATAQPEQEGRSTGWCPQGRPQLAQPGKTRRNTEPTCSAGSSQHSQHFHRRYAHILHGSKFTSHMNPSPLATHTFLQAACTQGRSRLHLGYKPPCSQGRNRAHEPKGPGRQAGSFPAYYCTVPYKLRMLSLSLTHPIHACCLQPDAAAAVHTVQQAQRPVIHTNTATTAADSPT
jgi:hypothetical protein